MRGSSPPVRSLLLGSCCCWIALLPGCWGKQEPGAGSCLEDGVCPPGQVCDRATGRCKQGPVQPDDAELGRFLSVAVQERGLLWIAGRVEGSPPALGVGLLKQGGDLAVELLAEGPGMAEGTSIALAWHEQPAQPWVAFHDAGEGLLRFAQRRGSTWALEVVDGPSGAAGAATGRYPSLAIDGQGRPWIAYHDEGRAALVVAHREEGRWHVEVADEPAPGEGSRGLYASLVLVRGEPLIAHHDAARGNLRLSLREDRSWRSMVLAGEDPQTGDTGDVGRFASAAVDPFGNAAVAFYDATRGMLSLAWNDRGVLRIEVVDEGGGREVHGSPRPAPRVGQYASLVFGRGGQPRIAYLDGAALDLLLAVREDGGWSRRTLASEGVAGLWAAQAVDEEGNSVVAHCRMVPDSGQGGLLRNQVEVLWP